MTTLYDQRREASRMVDLARAVQHDIEAQIEDQENRPLFAEWHRLEAVKLRNRSPEAEDRSHRAWLVAMATSHLRSGTVPDGFEAEAIMQTMDELRGGEQPAA